MHVDVVPINGDSVVVHAKHSLTFEFLLVTIKFPYMHDNAIPKNGAKWGQIL